MSAISWTGTTSTNWFTATNWSTNTVPTAADDVTIGTTANSPTITGTPFFTINSLTINGTDTLTVGDITSGNSVFMTVTNGITLSGGGGIVGQGNITGNITVTGVATTIKVKAVNAQNTPQLVINGTLTDPAGLLTLAINNDNNLNPDELILTKGGAAHAVTFLSNGGVGTKTGRLTLQDTGTGIALTVGSQMAIAEGTLFLAGASATGSVLTDTSGVTLTTGQILGQGKLDAAVTATGAANISTNNGKLEVTGSITSSGSLALTIANGGDTLLLDGTDQAQSVTFAGGSTLELGAAASLTVGTQIVLGNSTVKLDGPSSTLNDAAGLSLTTGLITGAGIVNAPINASSTAHITATGGKLQVNGTVANPGGLLVMTINGSSDTLLVGGTAAAKTVSFNAASGTLELGAAGILAVTDPLAVGTGTLKLLGGLATLHDLAGLTLSTGQIVGAGIIDSIVTANGAAQIIANGGKLELQHQLTDAGGLLTLKITGNSDTLQVDFNGQAKTVDFNGASGTFELNNFGGSNFTVANQMVVGTGTVKMDSAIYTLIDTNGITLNGGTITGVGAINANLSGTGTVVASGGQLELVTAIGANTGTTFEVGNGAATVLQVDQSVGLNNAFGFLGAAGKLGLGNDTGFNSTVAGLNVGTGLTKTNFVDIENHTVTVTNVAANGTSGTVTLSDGAVLLLTNISASNWFVQTAADGAGTDVFLTDTPCYCRGTLILTGEGEVAVEDLAIGDEVMTASGLARPIKWIGRRSYSGRFALGQPHLLPICIAADALAVGVPRRDLWISPNHAMYLEGVLIEARDLANGVSIVQAEAVDMIEYFHIELESHDLIIAEGALSESYIDDDNRGLFHNEHEYRTLYSDEPESLTQYCAPRQGQGYEVERARHKIAERAGLRYAVEASMAGALRGQIEAIEPGRIAGWAQHVAAPEAPVCLDILAGGKLIGQVVANRYDADLVGAGLGSGRHGFEFVAPPRLTLAPGSVEVRRSLDGAALTASTVLAQQLGRSESRSRRRAVSQQRK